MVYYGVVVAMNIYVNLVFVLMSEVWYRERMNPDLLLIHSTQKIMYILSFYHMDSIYWKAMCALHNF